MKQTTLNNELGDITFAQDKTTSSTLRSTKELKQDMYAFKARLLLKAINSIDTERMSTLESAYAVFEAYAKPVVLWKLGLKHYSYIQCPHLRECIITETLALAFNEVRINRHIYSDDPQLLFKAICRLYDKCIREDVPRESSKGKFSPENKSFHIYSEEQVLYLLEWARSKLKNELDFQILLQYYDKVVDNSPSAIAEELGISEKDVERSIWRFRKKLSLWKENGEIECVLKESEQ